MSKRILQSAKSLQCPALQLTDCTNRFFQRVQKVGAECRLEEEKNDSMKVVKSRCGRIPVQRNNVLVVVADSDLELTMMMMKSSLLVDPENSQVQD